MTAPNTLPRLQNGDRLDCSEFERRYDAMPHLKKAELVRGVVYVAAALRIGQHGEPHGQIVTWLGVYTAFTPKAQLADNATVRLDRKNVLQPDALLRLREGGQSRTSKDDYVEGPPELVVEVAASSTSYDLREKLEVYLFHQVREYIVWRPAERQIDWWVLRADRYVALATNNAGVLESEVFPGLWLDANAMMAGDLSTVLATLQQGLVTPEHREFLR